MKATKQSVVKRKWSLFQGQCIAEAVVEHLRATCERIDIAGSIRRECSEIEDIDIVLRPVYIWSTTDRAEIRDPEWHIAMRSLGIMIEGKKPKPLSQRRGCKILLPWAGGIQVDIAIPQEADYGRLMAIRTGSSKYAATVLASAWVRQHWRGTADGLRLEHECTKKGDTWFCHVVAPTKPPQFTTEEEFFDFLKLNYLKPKLRNL